MKFGYHLFIAAIAASTFSACHHFTANAAEQNLRTNNNDSKKDENRNLLLGILGSVVDQFIDDATLIGNSNNYDIQTINNNMFTIDGEQMDMTQFQQINVRNDQSLSASNIFQASVSDGEVIVRINQSGDIEHVAKIKSSTGTRLYLERLDGDAFIEFSSDDIDEDRLDDFILDDLPPPPSTRHLSENGVQNKVQGTTTTSSSLEVVTVSNTPDHDRQLQAGCDDITVIRVAVRYDSDFCQERDNSRNNAESYLEEVFAIINMSYRVSGLCKKLEICNMEGACNDGSNSQYDDIADSNAVCGGGDNVLDNFIDEVIDRNFLRSDECDLAQFVYGRHTGESVSGTIGCAYLSSLCDQNSGGVNEVRFSRNIDLRATLIAHEAGHNLGAQHDGATQRGFIMQPSICRCDEFSGTSKNQINNFVESRVSSTCTRTIPADGGPTPPPSPPTPPPTPPPAPECDDLGFFECVSTEGCSWFFGCN